MAADETIVDSEEMEQAAAEFEDQVVETFDVEREDVAIEAEQEPVPGADHDLVTLRARWVCS